MKTKLFILLVSSLFAFEIHAQEFVNIHLKPDSLNKASRKVYIFFDLLAKDKEHTLSIYDIDVFAAYNDNKLIKLEMLDGNKGRLPGNNRYITWHYFSDLPEFDGHNLRIVLEGRLNWAHEEKRYAQKGKISSVLNNIAFPGWGVNKVNQRRHNWWMGVLGYGLLGTGIIYRIQADQNYDKYKNGENILDAQKIYDQAYKQERISNYFFYGAGAVWLGSSIFTLIKGTQNQIRYQIIKQKNQELKDSKDKVIGLDFYVAPNRLGLSAKF